jgi:hypothetical protein
MMVAFGWLLATKHKRQRFEIELLTVIGQSHKTPMHSGVGV